MEQALLLNASYEPLKVVHWQKAITLWCQGKVEVIAVHDREIRAVSVSFKLPSVIRLLRFVKIRRRFDYVPFSRANIYARDDHACQYCGHGFPTAELTPYEPSYLSGFLAEENAVDLPEALESAKARMRDDIRAACSQEVPGDTQRNLQVQSTFSAVSYKNALLPIWIAAYDYRGTPYRYLVNGVTGKAHGNAPWSWVKITFAVMTAVIVALIVLAVMGQQ